MSYEGYVQVLCKAGHSHSTDCYTADSYSFDCSRSVGGGQYGQDLELWKCPSCGRVAGWLNHVDTTNDDGHESRIQLTEVTPSESEQCSMGHHHETKPATYKPSKDGGQYVNGGLA
jgi:hypothetical protein